MFHNGKKKMKLHLIFAFVFCVPLAGMELHQSKQLSPVVAGSQNYFDVLPNDIKAQILAELYDFSRPIGTKSILRFLRTAKKYYNDQDLTPKLMHAISRRYGADFRYAGIKPDDRFMQITFDLGTPLAISFLKDYYKTSPQSLANANEHFYYRARENNYRILRILKLAGADINAYKDKETGENAFSGAWRFTDSKNLPAKLRFLLYLGADINSLDKDGDNLLANFFCRPFHSEYIYFLSAKLLIEHGINFRQRNTWRKSAFSYATEFGFRSIVSLMQQQEEKKD